MCTYMLKNSLHFTVLLSIFHETFYSNIEFELLAVECGAPPGGRSKTGRKAAGAQRPTPCEAEGRASSSWGNRNSKACRFYWYKPFGCAPPKAPLYEATFSQNSKVEQSQIEIVVGISIFVEHVLSLLPTLGGSANLNEPQAPR